MKKKNYLPTIVKGNELCMSFNTGLVLNIWRDSKILRSITFEAVPTMVKSSSCTLTLHENTWFLYNCRMLWVAWTRTSSKTPANMLTDSGTECTCGWTIEWIVYRELIRLENYALIYLRWNDCEMTINDNKAIPENLVVVR